MNLTAGELPSFDDSNQEISSCHRKEGSPLTNNLNICPLNDEEFDEFDVIECTCQLPPNKKKLVSVSDKINKAIGNVFIDNYRHSIDMLKNIWRQADRINYPFKLEDNNICTVNTFHKIIQKRTSLNEKNEGYCSANNLKNNLNKYFNGSIGEIFSEVLLPKKKSYFGASFFEQPLHPAHRNQCFKDGRGMEEFEQLISKYKFNEENLTESEIKSEIKKMQNQCGFMFSSLAELLCSQKDFHSIGNQRFFEERLNHDPFDLALEVDDYFAYQSFFCAGEKQKKKYDENVLKCKNGFDSIDKLIAQSKFAQDFNQYLKCSSEILGDHTFLEKYGVKMVRSDGKYRDIEKFSCSLLYCQNINDFLNKNDVDVQCQNRKGENQIRMTLVDLSKVDCTNDNNLCENNQLNFRGLAITELFIKECKQMKCMENKDIEVLFSNLIKQEPKIKSLIDLSVVNKTDTKRPSEKFWDHFSGRTEVLAKAKNLTTETYVAALEGGFGNETVKKSEINVSQTDSVSPTKSIETTDTSGLNSNNVKERQLNVNKSFQPTFSAGSNSRELEILDREMEIHQELKKSINDLTKYKEIIANSSAGTAQRDRAFQELGRAQERIKSLERDFQDLNKLERKQRQYPDDTFQNRFSDIFNDKSIGSFTISDGAHQKNDVNNQTKRNQYDFSNNSNFYRSNSFGDLKNKEDNQNVPVKAKGSNSEEMDRPGLPKVEKIVAEDISAQAENSSNERVGDLPSNGGIPKNGLKGRDLVIANKLSLASLAKKDLKLNSAFQAEVVVDARKRQIDLLEELLNYKKSHPEFQLGHVLTIKQLDPELGTYKKARLIPTFSKDGQFSGYGIASDKTIRQQLIIREFENIRFRDLSRSEAYKLEMDIIIARNE